MNVHWTEAALSDLHAAEAYVARHSARYATSLVERIFARTGQLADQPHLGAMVPEHEEESLREVFEHPYRIIYLSNRAADRRGGSGPCFAEASARVIAVTRPNQTLQM